MFPICIFVFFFKLEQKIGIRTLIIYTTNSTNRMLKVVSHTIIKCSTFFPDGDMEVILTRMTLFRNKRFALNEMFMQNASKFAIFYVSEKVYVDIDQGIHKVKYKVARNEKRKKITWFF